MNASCEKAFGDRSLQKVTGKELYIPGLKDGDFPLRPLHSPELKQTIEFILIYL